MMLMVFTRKMWIFHGYVSLPEGIQDRGMFQLSGSTQQV